ncbi:diaminopimelate epimerase [Ulvibacter litoralis]|uniref:Diaminopimelate epimerase n=1 Tax=Ulvibacter litoralis TaxID=227084 RepID=A0A1G7EKD6_9FLAO|nr:diaminopimelate epimerase [Ulvibacter litoralis]GHC54717.1 diaminopimelate epimerase [Ulvibacter litoralis]SDE64161.1 diaminopimelate epimerase [Ulvibacter litoralis]
MKIPFYKYQGTGNDFVMIDNRQNTFDTTNTELVAQICDRRFGVGADGLILLENHPTADFKMVYYNSDGNISTMCGNGGRCIVQFAKQLGIVTTKAVFEAIDGMHEASINDAIVSLKMNDVANVEVSENHTFLNTGSPHHVELVDNLLEFDVKDKGEILRYTTYGKEGSNINFVEGIDKDTFFVRTYERGVEDETLSCGTGVTAVAIALHETGVVAANKVMLKTLGGILTVRFTKEEGVYKNVYLEGPATFVFKGSWE